MPRVVSLLPSATEIACLVGAGPDLVGRSHECDFPPEVLALPALTAQSPRSGAETGASPAEIDRIVRESLSSGGSLYVLDAEALVRLEPDVILTQDLCRVCSIDPQTVRGVAARLPRPPTVVTLNPTTLEGMFDDVLTVGRALGREDEARGAVVRLRERVYAALDHVPAFAEGPNVAFLEWTDPLYVGGHWTPQLIERAGGRHPLNPTVAPPEAGGAIGPQSAYRRAGPSVRVPEEVFAATRPEAIVICLCGLDLSATRRWARELSRRSWWADLPAVRRGRVALVDGNQMFNRPGPRLVDALEWLVSWLQDRPDLAPPGFPWEPFTP